MITIIGVIVAINATRPGFLLWPDLITGFTSASIFTGLIAAGSAATEANRWQRANGQRQASATRSELQVRSYHAVAVITPLGAGFWLAFGLIAVWAQLQGYYGSVPIVWIISLFCALVLASSLGYTIGTLAPYRWYVGPGVALLFYLGYIALTLTGAHNGVLSLYPAASRLDDIFIQPVNSTFAAQSVFFLSLSALLLLLTMLSRRISRAGALSALGSLLVAVLAGGTVVAANGQTTTASNPGVFTCVGDSPTLCLNPGYAPAGVPLQEHFSRLASITSGTGFVADRLEQNVQGFGDNPSDGARSVYLEQWATDEDLKFAVSRYVSAYGGTGQCGSEANARVNEQVDIWLSQYDPYYGDVPRDPAYDTLHALSLSDAQTWFSSVASKYFSCRLELADLP
ncbi:hypothetical protein [Clavibacter sp. VKM Ac-2872]|uniref:hypothetical protein n=1 Tax=Clavibacter sp. VKM Ac-2872 TaxID=2783812 RepID=UPI00188DAFB7|nr:hypothetical protein [Clavibacter sp. VKM Ac-2872]MBF4625209.1 hypothetical protein [Clavibacter sp. VKM Ac-2872]